MKNEKSVKETLEKVQNDLSLEQGEDLFASLLSDQKVMQNFLSLGFSTEDVKDYLIPLSEYQVSLHACAHCKNVNACQNSIPHFTYQLAVEDDGSLGLRMGRCEKILEKELAASRFLLRDFPEEWLLKFKEEPMTRNRKEVTLAYAKMNASKPFLYIKGALGTGKSFQAALLALAFVRRGEEAAFISCPKRFETIMKSVSDYKNPNAFRDLFTKLLEVPLLVLDDFGAEYKTAKERDLFLLPLLEERRKEGKFVIFTSRESYQDIAKEYGQISFGQKQGLRMKECMEAGLAKEIEILRPSLTSSL